MTEATPRSQIEQARELAGDMHFWGKSSLNVRIPVAERHLHEAAVRGAAAHEQAARASVVPIYQIKMNGFWMDCPKEHYDATQFTAKRRLCAFPETEGE